MIRFFDFTFSICGLILISPLFLIISLLIKITSKGPVLFKQMRVGLNNHDFKLYKFRTMKIDSDKNGLLTIGGNDSRITKIGNYLRKLKLDELPQLINVLWGDMSLVGPRPEVRKYVDLYNPVQLKVLQVKPGITDLASIYYKNENDELGRSSDPEKTYTQEIMPHKLALNQTFINNPSLFNYFKIIFKTFFSILK
ncbi:MAG: sugar transferase [Bacteroidota bacterium]|nr:sugar transferase [Bacteroidota bacterium]